MAGDSACSMDASKDVAILTFFAPGRFSSPLAHVLLVPEQNHYVKKESLGGLHSIGNWGVLIFFVHTSLVLMFSLERQYSPFAGEWAYLAFLVRRIFRFLIEHVCRRKCCAIQYSRGRHYRWILCARHVAMVRRSCQPPAGLESDLYAFGHRSALELAI